MNVRNVLDQFSLKQIQIRYIQIRYIKFRVKITTRTSTCGSVRYKRNIQNREIELVKFLHEPRTIKDIQAKFGVNERTIRLEREKLRDGIDFMGYKIKLDEKRDKNTFQLSTEDNLFVSTAHPFVLVLNLSQVYQLTILLLDSVKDNNILYDNYLLYANIIYSQLSEYATKIIDEANKNKHPLKKHFSLEFISEQNMFNENKNREFWYLKKIDEFADITYFNGKEIISNKLKPYNTKDDVLLFIDKDNNILELIATNIMNYSNIPGY